jgi:hypothetical protein
VKYLATYFEPNATILLNDVSLAKWSFETDLAQPGARATNTTLAKLAYYDYINEAWAEELSLYDYNSFDDSAILAKRQLMSLSSEVTAGLTLGKMEWVRSHRLST